MVAVPAAQLIHSLPTHHAAFQACSIPAVSAEEDDHRSTIERQDVHADAGRLQRAAEHQHLGATVAPVLPTQRGLSETVPGTTSEGSSQPPTTEAASPDDRRYAVGIELRPYNFTVMLTDEQGNWIDRQRQSLDNMDVSSVVLKLAEVAKYLISENLGHQFPRDRIVLGLQLGGPVDAKTGTVHFFCKVPPSDLYPEPEFRWEEDTPLGAMLSRAADLETIVENDADAFAVKEQWFGVGEVTDSFAVMLIREGVGGSIVTEGKLFPGPVEIGTFISSGGLDETDIFAGGLRKSDAGTFGALECLAGITAIVADVGKNTKQQIHDIVTAALLAEDQTFGSRATPVFTAAGVAAAGGLSYLVGFAGPSHIVLCGPAALVQRGRTSADAFLEEVCQFRGLVAHKRFQQCELVLRSIGPYDGALAAALSALQRGFKLQPRTKLMEMGPTK